MPLPNEQENPQSSDWLDWGICVAGGHLPGRALGLLLLG